MFVVLVVCDCACFGLRDVVRYVFALCVVAAYYTLMYVFMPLSL